MKKLSSLINTLIKKFRVKKVILFVLEVIIQTIITNLFQN